MNNTPDPGSPSAVQAIRELSPRARRLSLVAALVILVPGILLSAVAALLPTEAIANAAAEQATRALGVPVQIRRIAPDLFPLPGAVALDVKVGDVAQVDRIELRPRILPLLRGRVSIRQILIDRPQVSLAVDSSGALNLPFAASADTAATASGSADIDFDVDEFVIRDGILRYRDARDGTDLSLAGLNQELSLEGRVLAGELARIGLAGTLSADSIDASLPGRLGAPLRGIRVAVEHDALLDREADLLEIAELRVEVQRVALSGSGRLTAISDSLARRADLTLRAEEFSFDDLARSLPEGFLAALLAGKEPVADTAGPAPLEYAGRAAMEARVTGPLTVDSIPRVEGRIALAEVGVNREGKPILADAGGTIAFSSEAVGSQQIAGRLFGEPFALSFQVNDLAAPVATFAAKGTLRAEEVVALMPPSEEATATASGAVPFDLRGTVPAQALARASVDGTVGLGGVRLEMPGWLQPVSLGSGRIRLAGSELHLEDLAVAFGQSRLRASATADGWLPLALGDTTAAANVRFDAQAGTLDLDALLGVPEESPYTGLLFARLADRPIDGKTAAEAAEELGLALPELPRLYAQGNLRAEKLVQKGQTYEGVEVQLQSSPTEVSVPRLRLGMMGGVVELGLALDRREDDASLVAVYHLENLGAGLFFDRFTPFRGKLSGLMTVDGEASLTLDEHLLPVRPTVRSSGKLALTSGSLANWPLLRLAGERLGLASFDTLVFREWEGDYSIAGPLVTLQRSLQKSAQVETELAGSFDWTGALDLTVLARLSPGLVAMAGDEVRAAAQTMAEEGSGVPVGLRITGSAASPNFALDLSAARDQALARARAKAEEEAKGALRSVASEAAGRVLGDSVPVQPEQLKDAVRDRLRQGVRGLLGRQRPDTAKTDTAGVP